MRSAELFFCFFMGFPGGSIVKKLLQGGKWQEGDVEIDKAVLEHKERLENNSLMLWNFINPMEQNIFTGEQKLLQMHRKGEKLEKEGKYKYTVGPAWSFPKTYCIILSCAAAAAKSLESCPTLCDPTDGSPPGTGIPIPGILQARTLEWVAISFSTSPVAATEKANPSD